MKRFIYGWGSVWVQNETLTCCFLSFYRAMGVRYRHAAGKWEFAGAKPFFDSLGSPFGRAVTAKRRD